MAVNNGLPWAQGAQGATNFTRAQAQTFARRLIESKDYRDWLEERIQKHTLSTPIEQMLWHYAYGKPSEHVNVTVAPGQEDFSLLGLDELLKRAQELQLALEEAQQLDAAIPAQYKVA